MSVLTAEMRRPGPLGATVTEGGVNFSVYAYRAHSPFTPERGLRFDREKVLLDPHGLAVPVAFTFTSLRALSDPRHAECISGIPDVRAAAIPESQPARVASSDLHGGVAGRLHALGCGGTDDGGDKLPRATLVDGDPQAFATAAES